MYRGDDGIEELVDNSVPLPPPATEPAVLGRYGAEEDEDAVTRFVEPPRSDPTWLVQVTAFDRRSMSRAQLLHELRRGVLVHGGSLVWRRGMADWHPLDEVAELRASEPGAFTLPPRVRPRPAPSSPPLLAAGAASLLFIFVTLALAWGGVFTSTAERAAVSATPAPPR